MKAHFVASTKPGLARALAPSLQMPPVVGSMASNSDPSVTAAQFVSNKDVVGAPPAEPKASLEAILHGITHETQHAQETPRARGLPSLALGMFVVVGAICYSVHKAFAVATQQITPLLDVSSDVPYPIALASFMGKTEDDDGQRVAVNIRRAGSEDMSFIQKGMAAEKMNPLFLQQDRFMVAEVIDAGGTTRLAGCGQIRPLDTETDEVASLYVDPSSRRLGIGTKILTALLRRHAQQQDAHRLCLLTLKKTMPFYEPWGFKEVETTELPNTLQMEYKAGQLVTWVLREELVALSCDMDTLRSRLLAP